MKQMCLTVRWLHVCIGNQNKLYNGQKIAYSIAKGFGGAVFFLARTNLVNYYERTLGAVEIANNRMMLIDGKGAAKLYEEYYGKAQK